LTNQWNDTVKNADPNDTSIEGQFRENVLEPSLQKFREAFSTQPAQDWAERHIEALRDHMREKASADMSTLAGDAVSMNVRKMTNNWTNTARNDPSSTQFLLDTVDSSIEGVISSSPNLKGAAAARVRMEVGQKAKEDIVRAGALGAMEKSADPEAVAASFSQRWPDYVDGKEIDQFAKAAKYYKRLGDSENRAQRVQRDYEAKNDFNQKVNELEASTMPKNPGDKPQLPPDYWSKLRELSTHPGAALEPGRLRTMVQQGEVLTERLNKPEPMARVSHEAVVDLLRRMRLPAGDPDHIEGNGPIYDEYDKGRLSNADFSFAIRESEALRTDAGQKLGDTKRRFLSAVEPQIDKSGIAGIPDPAGKERFYQFQWQLEQRIDEYRRAGKNPYDLMDPSKPDYMGKPDVVRGFAGPFSQQLMNATRPIDVRPALIPPPAGTVRNGYRFKGGDPSQRESWEKVQ
jgi:hypothetical protein